MKIERILIVLFLVGILLRLFLIDGSALVLLFSLLLLSMFYFGFGFLVFNHLRIRAAFKNNVLQSIPKTKLLLGIVTGVNLSMLCIGILFGLLHWPGYKLMLLLSIPPALVILIFALYKRFKLNDTTYKITIKRSLLFLCFGIVLLIKPLIFDEIRFRNHPEKLEELKIKIKEHTPS